MKTGGGASVVVALVAMAVAAKVWPVQSREDMPEELPEELPEDVPEMCRRTCRELRRCLRCSAMMRRESLPSISIRERVGRPRHTPDMRTESTEGIRRVRP